MAVLQMIQIEAAGVGCSHPLHAFGQVRFLSSKQDMIMAVHKDVCKDIDCKTF